MFGVFLFVLVLLIYGLILSRDIVTKLFVKEEEGVAEVSGFGKFMQSADSFISNKGVLFIIAFFAIVIGVWNLFAPNFGAAIPDNGRFTILGALLPSLAMIFNGLVLFPEMVEKVILPEEKKEKFYGIVDKTKNFMGIATLLLAILHIAFFKAILF